MEKRCEERTVDGYACHNKGVDRTVYGINVGCYCDEHWTVNFAARKAEEIRQQRADGNPPEPAYL